MWPCPTRPCPTWPLPTWPCPMWPRLIWPCLMWPCSIWSCLMKLRSMRPGVDIWSMCSALASLIPLKCSSKWGSVICQRYVNLFFAGLTSGPLGSNNRGGLVVANIVCRSLESPGVNCRSLEGVGCGSLVGGNSGDSRSLECISCNACDNCKSMESASCDWGLSGSSSSPNMAFNGSVSDIAVTRKAGGVGTYVTCAGSGFSSASGNCS